MSVGSFYTCLTYKLNNDNYRMSIFIILSLATSADFVRRIQYAVYPYVSCMINNTLLVRERQRAGAHGRHTTINHNDVYKRIIRTGKCSKDFTLSEQFQYQIGNS